MPQRLSYLEPAYAVRDCVLRYDPAWNTSLLFIGRAYKWASDMNKAKLNYKNTEKSLPNFS